MRRKLIKLVCATLAIMGCCANLAYASPNLPNETGEKTNDEISLLLPRSERGSSDVRYIEPRNSIISTAIADISNPGGGKIDILIETLAHVPCDEIRHKAYLEQWSDEIQDWVLVDSFMFVEYKEDHPDDDLTALTSTVTVSNQPAGYYYRVQGYHMVWVGDVSQGFSTRTDGVLITSK